jgi:mono/diheme cytochrome c family protein
MIASRLRFAQIVRTSALRPLILRPSLAAAGESLGRSDPPGWPGDCEDSDAARLYFVASHFKPQRSHPMNRVSNLIATAALAGTFLGTVLSGPAHAEIDKKTVRTWKAKCSSCHGEDGKAATEQGKKMGVRDMTMPDFWKGLTDAKMKDAIANGIKQTRDGKVQEMEPYKDKLKPEEIDSLVAYVKTFKT